MNYMLEDGSRALEVATTRPETMFGDTAVRVNPNDDRYKDLIGKKCYLANLEQANPKSLEMNMQTLNLVLVWLKSLLPTTLMTSWLVNAITCHKSMS